MHWFIRFQGRSDKVNIRSLLNKVIPYPKQRILEASLKPKALLSLFFLSLAFSLCTPNILLAGDNDADPIIYTKSGSDSFSATLIPDPAPGSVPNDPDLVEVTTNDDPTAFQLAPGQGGQVGLSGELPGLEDGRHTSAVKTLTPDGGQKDRKQVLLFVDTKNPVIELVAPMGRYFPRTAKSVRFKITDPEDGSGVSTDPEECGLRVAVSGASLRKSYFVFENNELNLLVLLGFAGGAAMHDTNFTVSVSLQDRAGNIGRISKSYTVRSLVSPSFEFYECSGFYRPYIQTVGEFLVESSPAAFTLTAGSTQTLSFFTRGYSGKNYSYPHPIIRERERREKAPEIFAMNTYFQEAVGDLIEIRSRSGNIGIRKMDDQDLTDSRVSFRVTQKRPVSMGERMDALYVKIPVSVAFDPSSVDFCESAQQIDWDDPEDTVYHHISEDAYVYTFETVIIPVFLETADEPLELSVFQDDDLLAAKVVVSPIELMDTGASWFEFDGGKYWFERQGESCVARGPAREGKVQFKIAAAHKIAEFLNLQGNTTATSRTMYSEGDIIVCMDPPEIKNFRYDRGTNTLSADIKDQGTPLEALAINLRLPGYAIDFDFDPSTGELTAALPYTPLSVLTASLSVTDRAKQTRTETCTIFGKVESEDEGGPESSDSSTRGPYTSVPKRKKDDIEKVIGTTRDGKALLEVCEDVMQWGYYKDGRFVPFSGGPGAVELVQLGARDPNASDIRRAISKNLPLHVSILGESYDPNRYMPISAGSRGVTSLSMTGNRFSGGAGRKIYFVVMARDGNKTIPLSSTGFGFGLYFKPIQTRQCRVVERDILPPVIRPTYDSATGLLTATIHDHGMPLSQLKIDLSARSDYDKNLRYWGHSSDRGSRPPFTFQNGILTSRFIPPPRGEFFILRLSAVDQAGNRSYVLVDVMVPQEPPEVSITQVDTQTSGRTISRSSMAASAYIRAEAKDDSKILPEKTTLWLDGQVLPPLRIYSYSEDGGWNRQANFDAGYVAGLEEGSHDARFRATDAAGLWAETTTQFDFQLAPFIYNFRVMPDAVRKIGGPALTAMIIDQGGDLDVSGLVLTIDGRPVDTSGLYYDPASGYFSVDGPLELAHGRHVAEVIATDSHGNQARDALHFTRSFEITTPYQSGGEGLVIDSLSLMELENQNGDGRANPGERVRLFVALRNETEDEATCNASLSSEDLDISVETASVTYGSMEPGKTSLPLEGFDLQIGSDILEKTLSDPYETFFDLTVGCDPDWEWVLPLKIPVFRPSVPIQSGMVVILDRLPPTTAEINFRIRGSVTTNAEFIDWMEVRVNSFQQGPVSFSRDGGRFEAVVALAEGSNTVEIVGADSNGASGSDSGYIYRTSAFEPPSINITSPTNGEYFICDNLTVTGTYNTGSGTLASITVEAPWEGGICPVDVIDGSNFRVDCGDVTSSGGIYDIEATIETTDGVRAVDTITIDVGDCS